MDIQRIEAVIGLGNPGNEYKETRHNVGFMVVDLLAKEIKSDGEFISGCKGVCIKKRYAGKNIYFLKPETFMNLSGESVASLLRKLNLNVENILVVYDDLDLPLGRIRIRKNGGSAGHNGVKSIIDNLQTQKFSRLRIGIGNEKKDVKSYVLDEFDESDKELLEKVLKVSVDAAKLSFRRPIDQVMNQYNNINFLSEVESD